MITASNAHKPRRAIIRRGLFVERVVIMALTSKQERFVAEYLVDLNATQAAIRAGYSEKTAYAIGQQNLKKLEIQTAIQKAIKKRARRVEITQDRVLQEYARLAFYDPRKLFDEDGKPKDISSLDDDTAAALAGLDVMEEYEGTGENRQFIGYTKKYKLANKLGALDSVAKHLGMFESGNTAASAQENNIFEVIEQSTREELDTSDIPEIESPAEHGSDLVE